MEAYQRALRASPRFAEALAEMGHALLFMGRLKEAADACRKAIEINPSLPEAYCYLGSTLAYEGQIAAAIMNFRRALAIKPDFAKANSNLLMLMNYSDSYSSEDIYSASRKWESVQAAVPASRRISLENSNDADRQLRVGYVSTDFCRHPVSFFFESLLRAHNKNSFRLFCYSDVSAPDETTKRLQKLADVWVNSRTMADEMLAELIRLDNIDILVDLNGHTGKKNRLCVFAEKPAPVQVTWLGYPNTTGLTSIDYRLTDAIADPPGDSDRYYAETLVRLPHSFLCYSPPDDAPAVALPPSIEAGIVTFGSFNNLTKIGETVINLWAEILHKVPGSRLLLKHYIFSQSLSMRDRYLKMFHQLGIEETRLLLLPAEATIASHLDMYRHMDIALDPFPYNGTTTTFESLWMGVPVVTLVGDRHAARVGTSILSAVDLGDLIAKDPKKYVEIAIRIADDESWRRELRMTLRKKMAQSCLCNAELFAHDVESAYREMWRRWCLGKSESAVEFTDRT